MAANTFSVYTPSPLYERVKQAVEDGKLVVRDVCNKALAEELTRLDADPAPHGLIVPGAEAPQGGQPDLDLSKVSDAADLAQQASEIEYQFSYSNNVTEAQAFLDHVASQGAWPVSHHVDLNGQISFVIAWPKVLTAVE